MVYHRGKYGAFKVSSILHCPITIQSGSEVWPHFFVLSRILKLHNINVIQWYAWLAEIEYYMYTLVQIEKPLNMKHNKKNKLQYYEKNYIKKDKSILML
jgi:hypothetical protein